MDGVQHALDPSTALRRRARIRAPLSLVGRGGAAGARRAGKGRWALLSKVADWRVESEKVGDDP